MRIEHRTPAEFTQPIKKYKCSPGLRDFHGYEQKKVQILCLQIQLPYWTDHVLPSTLEPNNLTDNDKKLNANCPGIRSYKHQKRKRSHGGSFENILSSTNSESYDFSNPNNRHKFYSITILAVCVNFRFSSFPQSPINMVLHLVLRGSTATLSRRRYNLTGITKAVQKCHLKQVQEMYK